MKVSTQLAVYTWSEADNVVRKETMDTFRVFINTHFMRYPLNYKAGSNDVYIYGSVLGYSALCTTAGSFEQAHNRFKLNSCYRELTFGEAA